MRKFYSRKYGSEITFCNIARRNMESRLLLVILHGGIWNWDWRVIFAGSSPNIGMRCRKFAVADVGAETGCCRFATSDVVDDRGCCNFAGWDLLLHGRCSSYAWWYKDLRLAADYCRKEYGSEIWWRKITACRILKDETLIHLNNSEWDPRRTRSMVFRFALNQINK